MREPDRYQRQKDREGRAGREHEYGDSLGRERAGTVFSPEDFPPTEWMNYEAADGQPGTVTIVPIITPSRDWGVLVAILPRERRYLDGFWALQYGVSLVALSLERDAGV